MSSGEGLPVVSPQGRDLSDLACPVCHKWLGDPEDPDIAHVSQAAGDHRAECVWRRNRPAYGS